MWFDACGYISATKEWALQKERLENLTGRSRYQVGSLYEGQYRFHCVIFPAMLKLKEALFYQVPANEFLNLEGNKLSTSKNWAVWLHEYLEEIPISRMFYVMH
jgi:methionyl-tRNA synthetase